jgi:hypothetical protein
MTKKYVRRISKCYLVEEVSPYPTEVVKICRSRRLAEHYVRVLSPKWEECFGLELTVSEAPFYEDLDYETRIVVVADDEGIEE